jgi:hypothetical protein
LTETLHDARREALLSLLAPFPEEQIGLLPRVTCSDCSNPKRRCENKDHNKKRCPDCRAWVSPKHIHIDYVGHADVTRKLLETDPLWNWEPVAFDEDGLPKLDTDDLGNPVGLWIRLTILGVTRLGYGSCPSNQSDAVKVLIGDAIRNSAMRFGVALDLWSKTERSDPATDNPVADAGRRATPARQQAADSRIVVDAEWVAVFERRLAESTLDTVGGFRQDVMDARRTDRINSETANRLLAAVKQKADELSSVTATGLPANKDGSVARSKLTDEELAAAGLMTKAEVRAHGKLARETVANPKPAERLPATPPDDPWGGAPAAADEVNGWPEAAKPGSGGGK